MVRQNTFSARKAIIDQVEGIPEYSIVSDDQLLVDAQSGDQQIEKLRPILRSMIQQHYGTECSLEESARALDISVGAAKSRLMRGRKTLRSFLKRRGVSDSRV
jgi:DNA-directed RNA polymerase specialized sigma24 family protein